MRNILKNRLALSTIVTTLIVILASVLLAGVINYFAIINVTSTKEQEESLNVTKQHLWYDSTLQNSEAAFMIVNDGGRDILVSKIAIRGQNVGWAQVFYFKGNFLLTGDISYIPNVADGSPTLVANGLGSYYDVVAATNDLTLQSGQSMLVYIKNPDSISVNDVGLTISIAVCTSESMYYVEGNVQAQGS